MLLDIPLIKLRYEILNVSLDELSVELDTPVSILRSMADKGKWTQWWPDEVKVSELAPTFATLPPVVPSEDSAGHSPSESSPLPSDPLSALDDSEQGDTFDFGDEEVSELESGTTSYLKDQGLRLQVFNMAKEVLLSHKYAALECKLIDSAYDIAKSGSLQAQELKHISALFKDLHTNMASGKSMSIGTDESGVPEVIIRDLRGRGA